MWGSQLHMYMYVQCQCICTMYLVGQIKEVDVTVGNHGIRVDGLSSYIGQSKQLVI